MNVKTTFNFILHFANLNLQEDDIPSFVFDNKEDLQAFILAEASHDVVYLISIFDRVFVCEDLADIVVFIEQMILKSNYVHYEKYIDVFVQEYLSYERAYDVALDMAEISPLCYDR